MPSPTLPTSSCEDLEAAATAAARLVAACQKTVEDAKAYEAELAQLRVRHAAILQLREASAGARAKVQDAIAAVARAVQRKAAAVIKRAAGQRAEARASARVALEQALAACGGMDIDPTTLSPMHAAAHTEALRYLHEDLAAEPPVETIVQVWRSMTCTTAAELHVPPCPWFVRLRACGCVCRAVTPAATAASPRCHPGRRGEGRRPGGQADEVEAGPATRPRPHP